jgi:hypothetical protein
MKTRILLTTIGAVAVTAITFNANAQSLSPRAAGNQIKHFAGTYNDPDLVAVDQGLALPPRPLGNQVASTAGTNDGVTPATVCVNNMGGSPRTIQACVEHPGTMPGCTAATVAPLK